jgi:hypothetical protein
MQFDYLFENRFVSAVNKCRSYRGLHRHTARVWKIEFHTSYDTMWNTDTLNWRSV